MLILAKETSIPRDRKVAEDDLGVWIAQRRKFEELRISLY
jgi:hypothetical protein